MHDPFYGHIYGSHDNFVVLFAVLDYVPVSDIRSLQATRSIALKHLQLVDLVVDHIVQLGVSTSGQALLAGELVDSYIPRD